MLYAVERFFLEFLRGDYVSLTLGLKSAQMTSVIAFVIAAAVFIYLHFKGSVDEPPQPGTPAPEDKNA